MGQTHCTRCQRLSSVRALLLAFCLLMGSVAASAQTLTVTGTVTSASDGEPLIGASVTVKGANEGATTDIDGNYSIKVSSGTTLTFSYVGFSPRDIKVTGNRLDVALQENAESLN